MGDNEAFGQNMILKLIFYCRVVSAWQALLSCYVGLLTMKNIHEDIINDTYVFIVSIS